MATTHKLSPAERKRLEDVKSNRLLLLFAFAGAGLLLLSLVSRLGLFATTARTTADLIVSLSLTGLGLGGVVAGLLWARAAAGSAPLAFRLFNGLTLASLSLTVMLCALFAFFFYDLGIRFAYILVILVAALGIFRLIFQQEFFVSAVILCAGAFLFYIMSRMQATILLGYANTVAWFVAGLGLLALLFLLLLWRKKGRLAGAQILSSSFNYLPGLVAALGLFCAPILCLLVTMSYLMYAALGFGAVLLAYGVYYTLRLL